MNAGKWIRREREERGWSRDELGFRSHVSPRLIWRYEHGEGQPSITNLQRIAEAFGIALPWGDESGDSSTARERSYAILARLRDPFGLDLIDPDEELAVELPAPVQSHALTLVASNG